MISLLSITLRDIVLLVFLATSAISDVLYQKIFNKSIIFFLILGITLLFFNEHQIKISGALIGFFAGFVILLPFFIVGAVGPGDVKFLAVVGFLSGDLEFLVYGLLYGAICGGIGVTVSLIRKKQLKKTLQRTVEIIKSYFLTGNLPPSPSDSIKIPYVFYLSIGFLIRFTELKGKRDGSII